MGDRDPLLGQLGLQGRVVPFPVGEHVAQTEHAGNEVIAGGMIQIKHATILRLPRPLENPYPQI